MRASLATFAALLCATSSADADGVVRGVVEVKRPSNVAAGAVLIYVVGFGEPATKTPVIVKQDGKRFLPDLVAVTAGGTATFPNGDPFLHNVFSPTSERTFDVGSYKQGDTRSRTFPTPGVLDIYCNIHPEMSATLVVLPNRRFAIADATGRFEISVPAGTWSVFAYSRRADRPTSTKITVTEGGTVETSLTLDEVPRDFKHRNKYGEEYRETTIYRPGA